MGWGVRVPQSWGAAPFLFFGGSICNSAILYNYHTPVQRWRQKKSRKFLGNVGTILLHPPSKIAKKSCFLQISRFGGEMSLPGARTLLVELAAPFPTHPISSESVGK